MELLWQINVVLAHVVFLAVLTGPCWGVLLLLGAGSIQADAEARRKAKRYKR